MKKRLSEMPVGTTAIIQGFETNDLFLKLLEMGLVPGEIVKVDQRAPLGGPLSIIIAGYSLSLRLDEAEMIWAKEVIPERKAS